MSERQLQAEIRAMEAKLAASGKGGLEKDLAADGSIAKKRGEKAAIKALDKG